VVVIINIVVFRTVTPYRCLNPEVPGGWGAAGSAIRLKTTSETTPCYGAEGEIPVFCKLFKQ